MMPACLTNQYVTYFFPACVNILVFQTDLASQSVTFRFAHRVLGYFDITKTTGVDGKFTFSLADVAAATGKEHIFNPYFGIFSISVLYAGQQYVAFYLATGKRVRVAIKAHTNFFASSSFVFDKFIISLTDSPSGEPPTDDFLWHDEGLWDDSELWLEF